MELGPQKLVKMFIMLGVGVGGCLCEAITVHVNTQWGVCETLDSKATRTYCIPILKLRGFIAMFHVVQLRHHRLLSWLHKSRSISDTVFTYPVSQLPNPYNFLWLPTCLPEPTPLTLTFTFLIPRAVAFWEWRENKWSSSWCHWMMQCVCSESG